jgi:hypothetical protein
MSAASKHARVYFRRDGKQVLVVTVHTTPDGRLLEADGPLSLTTWNGEELGESVQTALDQSTTAAKDRRESGLGNEGTLKVSGEPSLRAFESSYLAVNVSGVTGAQAGFVIQGVPDRETDITISTHVPDHAPSAELASQVTRIYQVCRDRRF